MAVRLESLFKNHDNDDKNDYDDNNCKIIFMQLNRFESELVLYLIESTLVILHGNSANI